MKIEAQARNGINGTFFGTVLSTRAWNEEIRQRDNFLFSPGGHVLKFV